MKALMDFTARALLAAIFLVSGFGKLGAFEATQGYMTAMGVPGSLLPLVIAFEIAAGAAVLAGWQTRIAAGLLAAFCVVSALVFHANLADSTESILFLKNLAMAGGFLLLVVNGPASWSVDGWRARQPGVSS